MVDSMQLGAEMLRLAKRLFHINRSLAGPGNRETLSMLAEIIPDLQISEVPTGTKYGEWTVPPEWIVRKAQLIDPDGRIIADFDDHNLHLVGYSIPVDKTCSLEELLPHLHSLPEQPDAIPYVTSYYKRDWGFCITENIRSNLKSGAYRVVIDSELIDGSMTIGESVIKGKSSREILISTYFCHPQMANNELSGPVVSAYLSRWVSELKDRHFTYRFVFAPETIGAIAYISRNLEQLKRNVLAGYVITCIGDDRSYTYLESRSSTTLSDRIAKRVMTQLDPEYERFTFMSRGSDERQYCAPGVDLPIGSIMRSKYGTFPEYHTSLDDFNVVTSTGLAGGFEAVKRCIEELESEAIYIPTSVGEPHLSAYDLYPTSSYKGSVNQDIQILLDVLAYADGTRTSADIAEDTCLPLNRINQAIETLNDKGLLRRI
jgi:aminopeptidase-like protein